MPGHSASSWHAFCLHGLPLMSLTSLLVTSQPVRPLLLLLLKTAVEEEEGEEEGRGIERNCLYHLQGKGSHQEALALVREREGGKERGERGKIHCMCCTCIHVHIFIVQYSRKYLQGTKFCEFAVTVKSQILIHIKFNFLHKTFFCACAVMFPSE